jgi:hypothetical protein
MEQVCERIHVHFSHILLDFLNLSRPKPIENPLTRSLTLNIRVSPTVEMRGCKTTGPRGNF